MTQRFIAPTLEEWQALCKPEKGWQWTIQGNERIAYNDACCRSRKLRVKVYTTIPRDASLARYCGQDAIRLVLVRVNDASKELGAASPALRVFRVPGWQDRVKSKILTLIATKG
jgi:hypothetical protein